MLGFSTLRDDRCSPDLFPRSEEPREDFDSEDRSLRLLLSLPEGLCLSRCSLSFFSFLSRLLLPSLCRRSSLSLYFLEVRLSCLSPDLDLDLLRLACRSAFLSLLGSRWSRLLSLLSLPLSLLSLTESLLSLPLSPSLLLLSRFFLVLSLLSWDR